MASPASEEQVQKLYIAYFGRPADPAGLKFYADGLDLGVTDVEAIATSFGQSAEAQLLINTLTNVQFVQTIYEQSFSRPYQPALDGTFWLDAIDRGVITKELAFIGILEGARNEDFGAVSNKVTVAQAFTDTIFQDSYVGPDAILVARSVLANITDDPATVGPGIANAIAEANELNGVDPGIQGEVFRLTTEIDVFDGTVNDDLFDARPLNGQSTFEQFDRLDGGLGQDTILFGNEVISDLSFTNVRSIEQIETANSVNLGSRAEDAGINSVELSGPAGNVDARSFDGDLDVFGNEGNNDFLFSLADDGLKTADLSEGLDDVIVSDATGLVDLVFTSVEVGNTDENDSASMDNQDGGLAVRLQDGAAGAETHRFSDEGVTFTGATFAVSDLVNGTERGNFQTVVLGTSDTDTSTVNGTANGNVYINGGQGDDRLGVGGTYDANSGEFIADTEFEADTAGARHFLVGGAGDDQLNIASEGETLVIAGGGDDMVSVQGNGQVDLNLGDGDDVVDVSMRGVLEDDVINGGLGNNTLDFGDISVTDEALANVRFIQNLVSNGDITLGENASEAGIENVVLADGATNVDVTGFDGDIAVTGNDLDNTFTFSLADDGEKSANLAGGDNSVVVADATGIVDLQFTSTEVGNGNVNDSNSDMTQDGGLAVRMSDPAVDAVHRFSDEGVTFTGATFAVSDLVNGTERGDFETVVLGTQDADTETVTGTDAGNVYINAGMGDDLLGIGGTYDMAGEFIADAAFAADTADSRHFLVGGGGNDTLNIASEGMTLVLAGGGDDSVTVQGSGVVDVGMGDGDDRVDLSMRGLNEADLIAGGDGFDTLALDDTDLADLDLVNVTGVEALEVNGNAVLAETALAAGIEALVLAGDGGTADLTGFDGDIMVTGNDGDNSVTFSLTDDGEKSANLAGGDNSVVVADATGIVDLQFTSTEVGNGNVNDSNSDMTQDGGLAVRMSDPAVDAVHRFSDEGVTFTGATFAVSDLVNGTERGDFETVVLGTQDADTETVTGTDAGNVYINAGMGDDLLGIGGTYDMSGEFIADATFAADTADSRHFLVGGGGNDTLNIASDGESLVIAGGGNDSLAVQGVGTIDVAMGAGDDVVDTQSFTIKAEDIISAGADRDTLKVSASYMAAAVAGVTGFEVLAFSNADIDQDLAAFNTDNVLDTLVLDSDNSYAFDNAEVTLTDIEINASAESIAVSRSDLLADNALTITSGGAEYEVGSLTLDNESSLSFVVDAGDATGSLVIDELAAAELIDLSVGGDGDFVINDTLNSVDLESIDTTESTGVVAIDTSSSEVNMTATAGTGNTLFITGSGNDMLIGGEGNDILAGGLGIDTITGGAGTDTFLYLSHADSTLANMDTITDFSLTDSEGLDLSALSAAEGTRTMVSDYSGEASFQDALDQAAFANTSNNGTSVFQFGGNTYVYVEQNAVQTSYDNDDLVVELQGVIGVPGATLVEDFIAAPLNEADPALLGGLGQILDGVLGIL